jgi:predicted phosphate transport protein (TIGR00153 family)
VFQVIPRDRFFFPLFERAAENVDEAAGILLEMTRDLADSGSARDLIKSKERTGDELTHEILARVNTTFVTPFDRSDIFQLASTLDDILDYQDEVADLLVLLGIRESLPRLVQQADALSRTTRLIAEGMGVLESRHGVERICLEVGRIEKEADRIYRKAVSELFASGVGTLEVLKWKDIIDAMEHAMDSCEDVANLFESIALRYD